MQFQKKEKRQTTVRFDSHHVRLRTGEVQRKTGSYMYRWTDKLGKRNTIPHHFDASYSHIGTL